MLTQCKHFVSPLHVTQDVGENYYVGGGIFLLVFIAIGAFVFANLVVAVVVTNLVSTLPIHVVPRWRFSRLSSLFRFVLNPTPLPPKIKQETTGFLGEFLALIK